MFTAAAVDHLVVQVGGSNDDGTDVSSLSGNETTSTASTTSSEDDTETISTASSSGGCKSGPKGPNATYQERLAMLHFLLQNLNENGMPKHGIWKEAEAKYKKSYKTIKRIWNRHLQTAGENGIGSDVSSRRKKRCGRKQRSAEDFEQIKDVPPHKRTSLRALSEAINVPYSTLQNALARGTIQLKHSKMRPTLTEDNKLARVDFVINKMIKGDSKFDSFDNYIHIDEKWFYMTKEQQSFYGVEGEEVETRSCKSKRFITKVMFLAAVARPRYIDTEGKWFDGRIGIWPFVYQKPAERSSKNRPKGTMETKPITSVDADVYSEFMLTKVLPAIKERWPQSEKRKPIIIQEDNCKVHKVADEFVQAATKERLHVEFHPQPPNSPDFNVLDLGFFNSIQSLKEREQTKTIDELCAAVDKAYWSQDHHKLDDVFLSLQGAFLESLKLDGCNKYKMAHMKKQMKRRAGTLERQVDVDPILIAKGRELLDRTNFHQRMKEKHQRKKKRRKVDSNDTSDPLIPSQPSEIL